MDYVSRKKEEYSIPKQEIFEYIKTQISSIQDTDEIVNFTEDPDDGRRFLLVMKTNG